MKTRFFFKAKKSTAMKLLCAMMCAIMIFSLPCSLSAEGENKLYFHEEDEKLYYDAALFDEAIFMYHEKMAPGDSFVDTLKIKNECDVEYDLFFRVVPVEQSEEADELLENLTMTIYLDDTVVYEGFASGQDYSNNGVDLRNAMKIGTYAPGVESTLKVHLNFNKEYPVPEEESIWSRIDWEFWGEAEDLPLTPIEPPPTGDDTSILVYVVVFAVAFVLLVALLVSKKRKAQN